MMQQRPLALAPDAGHVVEGGAARRLGPLGAVRADGEAMSLVAQSLQEIEHRVAPLQAQRRPSRQEKPLAPGIAVGALGDGDDGDVVDAEVGEHLLRDAELPGAAVDDHQVGPGLAAVSAVFLEQSGEAPGQHLAHHAVVVARGDAAVVRALGRALDGELAIGVLEEAVGAGDDHDADRVGARDVAVVVDLDALRRRFEVELAGQIVEQPALRRALRQSSRQRQAGVVERPRDKLAPRAPPRMHDAYPPPAVNR